VPGANWPELSRATLKPELSASKRIEACKEESRSYSDESFQRPLSALFSGPQASVALIEAGRFRTGRFGKRGRPT
jgi:hypothetical protein